MTLLRLEISDFRNLSSVQLQSISENFNLIYGNNGSGKTSLLEAIYYLGLGRSFRSMINNRLIRNTADRFSLFSQTIGSHTVGIERQQNGEVKIRISGRDVHTTAELAQLIPVQLINSHCYSLLDAGPVYRRKYLDWGVFYWAADFLRLWQQFGRALKQRNAALRGHRSRSEIAMWSNELVSGAVQLNQLRQEYIQHLLPELITTLGELLDIAHLEIHYLPGWPESSSYEEALAGSIDRDIQLGYTQFGPHRADIKITINKIPAKDILSRGQQKLFVCAMILTQGVLLHRCINRKPIYLIDDLPAELDLSSRSSLIALLSKQNAQVFITTVERETVADLFANLIETPIKVFHVEHGRVTYLE